jgi:hypothetical protein
MHARTAAPAILAAAWDPQEAARAAVEFAEKYAPQVEADQKQFAVARGTVAQALGLL